MIEIKHARQSEGESCRRWFSDEYFDLIIWQDGEGDIVRFELCYGKNTDEHAVVWNKETGHSHHKVDDGENELGRYKMSPILIADGYFDRGTICAKFIEAGKDIDQNISQFVFSKLKDYDKKA